MLGKIVQNKIYLVFYAIPILVTLIFTRSIMQGYSLPKLALMMTGISILAFYMLNRNLIKVIIMNIVFIWPIILYASTLILLSMNNAQNFNLWFFGVDGRLTGVMYRVFICIYFILVLLLATKKIILDSLRILSFLGFSLSCFAFINLIDPQIGDNVYKLTFNNTNFSAFFLSISAVSTLYFVHNSVTITSKIFNLSSSAIQIFLIVKIGDTQGYVFVLTGFFLYLTIYISYKLSNKFLLSWLFLSAVTAIYFLRQLSAGKGLLFEFLNTGSFQDRLYLWKYGLEIFKDNLLFGVGLTRYGDWEPRYRSEEHILKLNLDSSDFALNPHNAFVQSAVEGGIFLLSVFILFIIYVTYRGILSLSDPKNRSLSGTVLIIWILYLLSKFVSVDNISIDIWGMLCGAYLVYLSSPISEVTNNSMFFSNINTPLSKRTFLTNLKLLVITFIIFAPNIYTINNLYQSVQLFNDIRVTIQSNNQIQNQEKFIRIVKLSESAPILEIRLAIIIHLLKLNQIDSALIVAKKTTLDFPNRAEGWHALASIYEDLGKNDLASGFRAKSMELRPLDITIKSGTN